MRNFLIGLSLLSALSFSASAKSSTKAFIGRWDFDVASAQTVGANWLSVEPKGPNDYEIWFQPTGGHVIVVKDYKLEGEHLTLHPNAEETWELTPAGDRLTGTEKHGDKRREVSGVRAPALKRKTPKAWSEPEALFNGKDLDGWEPIGDPAKNHWVVKDGLLVNDTRGDNLKTTRTFDDFKVHFEVTCPEDANSGFYLRGRYEVQLEYEAANSEPPERAMGAVYGRLAPSSQLPRIPGKWESFDITLIGRMVTVVRDGTTIIDNKEIAGITGGALNADEGKPGPFYIQGDHTGGLLFRNITVSVPKEQRQCPHKQKRRRRFAGCTSATEPSLFRILLTQAQHACWLTWGSKHWRRPVHGLCFSPLAALTTRPSGKT